MTPRGPDPFRYTRHPAPEAWWVQVPRGQRIGVVRKVVHSGATVVWHGYDLNGRLRCVSHTRRSCAALVADLPGSSFQGVPT